MRPVRWLSLLYHGCCGAGTLVYIGREVGRKVGIEAGLLSTSSLKRSAINSPYSRLTI